MKSINIEAMPEFNNHKMISFFCDKKTGLKGFICVHNNNLGSATGGTRYFKYDTEEDALRDGLRLSMAMTYKCALADVPYGGGKAVIMSDGRKNKNEEYLKSYADKINMLHGNFTTGEDVGMSEEEIETLTKYSKFIFGRRGMAGDLSPFAALGVFHAARAALKAVFGSEEMQGKTFIVKGLGKVGTELCRLILEKGGSVVGADINSAAAKTALKKFPKIKIVNYKEAHKQKADMYLPCALGKEFSYKTIRELRCAAICGAANNQLVSPFDGETLFKKNILYIPDYVANAGGLINIVSEIDNHGYSREKVINKIENIYNTASLVIELSKKKKKPLNYIADELAEKKFMFKK